MQITMVVGHVENHATLKGIAHGKIKAIGGNKITMKNDSERLFVMQHMMNSMCAANVSTCGENVWYVESGAVIVACKVAWLHKLLGDFGLQMHRKVVLYCDNLSNIQLAHN